MYSNSYFFQHIPTSFKNVIDEQQSPFESLASLTEYLDDFFDNKDKQIVIGDGTNIGECVVIQDHVIIGKNCTIMPHALIRPYTIIGDNCVIGHAAEIKHSIIMDGAKAQSFAFVGDSILGKSARIGSGAILANRGFNQEVIQTKIDGKTFSCLSDFFGAVVGDYARIGANSTTQPGTLIGPYSWVFPHTNVWGFIPAEKTAKNSKNIIIEDHEKTDLRD